ncbi:53 kDa protein [Penicillium aurantiogriseum fusarivirus 1]|uniref:53 kDa protein n=1 Tax=Penicillium aurantiogriseum fusarivirus 1 TaxID=1755752 RepID=A0A0S2KPA9_9VIRU|nr:53 kDa protein [Penicillium aurantiogriseum fusarivirus 1]ALO50126.1 53 kDa protein [Penicillium aurantiogriseum fusarivirus 1]
MSSNTKTSPKQRVVQPPSVAKTENSESSAALTVSEEVQAFLDDTKKAKQVELMGLKYVYVKASRLKDLEDSLESALEHGTSRASDDTLLQLNDELQRLRKHNQKVELAHAAANAEINKLKGDFQAYADSVQAIQQQNREMESKVNAEQVSLKKDLEVAKANNEQLKVDLRKARQSNDPDTAAKMIQQQTDAANKVTSINNKLQEANQIIARLTKESADARSTLSKMNAEIELNKDVATRTAEAMAISKEAAFAEVEPAVVQINRPWVTKALGQKGLTWIQKAEQASRIDARERAYRLLQATASGKGQAITSLRQIIQIAYDWIKTKSFKARERLLPWLNEIEADLRTGVIKAIKHYRERLEAIIDKGKEIARVQREKFNQWQDENPESWLTWLTTWGETLWGRYVHRPAKRFKNWLVSKWNQAKGYRRVNVTEDDVEEVLFENPTTRTPIVMIDKGKARDPGTAN